MSTLWRKLKKRIDAASRQQVTTGGMLYLVAVLLVALAAFVSANNLLFLLLAAMLATMYISSVHSRLSLAALELELLLPEHVAARHRLQGHVRLRNAKHLLPSFSIRVSGEKGSAVLTELYFPHIPPRTTIEEPVEVEFERRGIFRDSNFQFQTAFPFGFLRRRIDVTLRREVLVYPSILPQPGFESVLLSVAGELESNIRGQGHDFYRIRPYTHTESARHVDWKATAHTGDLQVREFAREEDCEVRVLLDLDASPAEEDWFESAVDFCAFLVWNLSLRGAKFRLETQRASFAIPEQGDAYTILKYLALAHSTTGKLSSVAGDERAIILVLTTHPERFHAAALLGARILHPGVFPNPVAAGEAAGAGGDQHHGDGKHPRGSARKSDGARK